MRAWIPSLAMVLAVSLAMPDAEARKGKPPAKKAKPEAKPEATQETRAAVTKLLGEFKWGMPMDKVMDMLELSLRAVYEPKIQNEKDPLVQDRLRKEMLAKVKELRATHIRFEGKRTPWDVSLVEKEFAHKNDESMIYSWGDKDRRFYFFYHDKLYKIYIAFNQELFKDKTFEDFAQVMEARFGKAERKYSATLTGDPVLDHMEWPPVEGTMLRAIDNTGFYGNFCLVVEEISTAERVKGNRDVARSSGTGASLVDSVLEGKENVDDPNADIVDQITGKDSSAPVPGEVKKKKRKVETSPGDVSPETPKKKNKVNTADPLDGMDL